MPTLFPNQIKLFLPISLIKILNLVTMRDREREVYVEEANRPAVFVIFFTLINIEMNETSRTSRAIN